MPDAHPIGRRMQFGIKRDVAGAFFGNFGPRSGTAVKSLPEQLADQLVEQIINGDFMPGQRLGEAALAERFEVSRGPVREALRLLEREGLVTMTSWRGASVRKLSHKNLSDIFAARAALMGLCAEQLAEDRPPHVLDTLAAGTRKLREASEDGRVDEFIVIVYQLSMYLAEAPGNEVTFEVLFSLGRQTLSLTRRAFEQIEHREAWACNWTRIVEAIQSGDRESARWAAHRLIAVIKVAAVAALDTLDAGEAPPGGGGEYSSAGEVSLSARKPA